MSDNYDEALHELRMLVGTYLEGSDDAQRAAELLDALDARIAPQHGGSGTVAVGRLSVEIFDGKVNAIFTIGGQQPVAIDVEEDE